MIRLVLLLLFALSAFAEFATSIKPLLKTHCYDCHNAEKRKGEIDLTALPHEGYGEAGAAIWATALGLF